MISRKTFKLPLVSAVSALLIGFFVLNVDPSGKPLPYILVPIVLSWIFLYSTLLMVVTAFLKNTLLVRMICFASVSTVVLLLLISGVGNIDVGDIVLVTSLVAVMAFYFYRTWG